MVATEILMSTIFTENFTQNIFDDLKFFSNVHISRENRDKVILGTRFGPRHEGGQGWGPWVPFDDTRGHSEELPSIKAFKNGSS